LLIAPSVTTHAGRAVAARVEAEQSRARYNHKLAPGGSGCLIDAGDGYWIASSRLRAGPDLGPAPVNGGGDHSTSIVFDAPTPIRRVPSLAL